MIVVCILMGGYEEKRYGELMNRISKRGAIVLIANNRPQELRSVLSAIRDSKRAMINELVIALQLGNKEVETQCNEIDWIKTRLVKKFPESQSIKKRINENVYAGIRSGFEDINNDWVVIIEDDIIVSEDFFNFVQVMMNQFFQDEKFFGVNGFSGLSRLDCTSSQFGKYRYGFGWGWAISRDKWIYLSQYWNGDENFHWDQLIEPIVKTGFVVMPLQSRILNIGFNEKASHTYVKGEIIHPQERKLRKSFSQFASADVYEETSRDLNWRQDCRIYLRHPKYLVRFLDVLYNIKKGCRVLPESTPINGWLRNKVNGVLELSISLIYVYVGLKRIRKNPFR